MSLDTNIVVSVTSDPPPVAGAAFGTPAVVALPGSLGAGFTERQRTYSSITAVNADVTSGDLGASIGAALTALFSQSPRVASAVVIKLDSGSPMAINVLIAGTVADADTVKITIAGISYTYTATVPSDDADAVATGLRSGLTTALAALDVTVGGSGANVTVTGDSATDFFTYFVEVTGTTTATLTVTESGVDLSTDLAAAAAESSAWYAFTLESRIDAHQLAAAVWAEASGTRFFMGQASTEGINEAAVTTDIASVLKAAYYQRSSFVYYSDDTKWTALAWLATKLEANPDTTTTNWPYATLESIAADTITATQKAALEGKNCNMYSTLLGRAATWQGITCSGDPIDKRLSLDWTKARLQEQAANLLLQESNANRKIPYTDAGIQQVVSALNQVGAVGEGAGHFVPGSWQAVNVPTAASIASATKALRTLSLEFEATLAGAIEKLNISVSLDI